MQVQQCGNSLSVGLGGPIKDVDWDHPAGKGDAFVPKAGRDAEQVVHDIGHGAEHFGNEVGKTAARIFG